MVTSNNTIIEEDYTIVSVPLGLLKNGTVKFTQALPTDKFTAITQTNMGYVNKF